MPKFVTRRYTVTLINVKRKSCNLRSNGSLLLEPPKGKMLPTLGARSFHAASPALWNSLPAQLRKIQSHASILNILLVLIQS